jgi:AcrR family transcriptional regulator
MATDSKKQILQTALKMFLRNPYKEVSLRDIVNEVGLTKGAFYHYYTSKEQLFGETARYFYNNALITNYKNFPKTSLKEFYEHYLTVMQNPDDFDEIKEDVNFFVFLSEASKRVPDFLEIHVAQQKKEIWAWAEIIEVAKRSKEIRTDIPNEELASMFLNMSDGIVMKRTIGKEGGMDALDEIKRDWDNLYNILKTSKK